MDSLRQFIERIDNLTIRERFAIMLALIVVLYTFINLFFLAPLANEQKILLSQLQQKQATQAAINAQIQALIADQKNDPNQLAQQRLNELKKELEQLETSVVQSTVGLISPRDMARILETVLYKTGTLSLVRLKSLGAKSLLESTNDGEKKEETISIDSGLGHAYLHGIRIEFEGNYMSTLDYLRDLESLEWKFFWDSFEFEVIDYPRSSGAIEVYTLSLDKDWIDV